MLCITIPTQTEGPVRHKQILLYVCTFISVEFFVNQGLCSTFTHTQPQLKSVAHLPWKAIMYKVKEGKETL